METLTITTQMPHFRLISKVAAVSTTHMEAEAMLYDAPSYVGLEIMAQAAALHVRQRMDFTRHAFLLSVRHCTMPHIAFLKGCYRVKAVMGHQSSDAFSYDVKANGPDGEAFHGDLLIGTRSYDDHFQKAALSTHYQQIWARLKGE